MATVLRRPLTARQPDQPAWSHKLMSTLVPPLRAQSVATTSTSNKRPRSPGADDTSISKRIKGPFTQAALADTTTNNNNAAAAQHATTTREAKEHKEKLRQKEEREQARKEFVTKYTKAFPSFVFYFDERDSGRQQAESRVLALGARIEHFFSTAVTHVITNRPQPPKNEQYDPSNKENATPRPPPIKGSLLKSPIQLKGRAHDHGGYDKLVRDAVQLDKKIWNIAKLDNILSRLLPSTATSSKTKYNQQSTPLTQLLQHERLTGTTSERDPRERRHDYQYFSKNSHFFLIEDIRGELAPIAIMEYSAPVRSVDKDKNPAYPVLYMDPRARSPFVKFDEKEERKQAKIELNDALREKEKQKHYVKVKEQLRRQHEEKQLKSRSLRRSASMSQLGRRVVTRGNLVDLDSDTSGSVAGLSNSLGFIGEKEAQQQIASGFGQSTTGLGSGNAYLAASGNSVAITSTTTTSFTRAIGSGRRLPAGLRERLGRQVVTSRRLEGASGKEITGLFMGEQRLRKAKSTTTMRLPTREESKKPGYCEACRVKFEDFNDHVNGSRHRKFAQNPNNYMDLDFLLRRLQRKLVTDGPSNAGSPEMSDDVSLEDDTSSDACLGSGDYFYISPQEAVEEADAEEDEWEGEDPGIPQIVIDVDDS